MRNYKTLREIGKGGMSTVYLARQIPDNQLVALKILRSDSSTDSEYIKRFFREARITAQLNHPNIIRIFESNFSQAEGLFYIVTEYIDGGNFRELLQQPGINLKQKLLVLHKVILALDYAHKSGIVHRDIKPSNILLTKKMEPKLCDFGIATALWGPESRLTRTDEVMGTMDYIAPEQKENTRNVDFRADIYSIGVILYKTITGLKPQGAFPPPSRHCSAIPPQLDALVMKCLQPLPADRYKNARNLADELFHILELPINTPNLPQHFQPVPPSVVEDTQTFDAIETTSLHPNSLAMNTRVPVPRSTSLPVQADPDFPAALTATMEKMRHGSIGEKLAAKPLFLNQIQEQHQDILVQLLPFAEGFFKEAIIEALGKLKSKNCCAQLIELLSDPYYNKAAAAACGEIGCLAAEEKLFKLLLTHNENSYIALIPLGKLNSLKSIDVIAQYLTDRHLWAREMALDALALLHDPVGKGNEKIIGYIEHISTIDADANIRAKAKKILWRLKK